MRRHSELRLVLVLCLFGLEAAAADEAVQLSMRPVGSQVELRWPGAVRDSAGRLHWPLFEIQQSTDLQHWQPINRAFRADRTILEPELRQSLAQGPAPSFYRLMARLDDTFTAAEGAEVFGYASSLADELRRIGSISPAEFSNRYAWPEGHYLETLSWDPANCPNWPAYQPLPGEEVAYAEPPSGMETPNITHFRLNDAEAAVLRQNGFMASERLGAYSFPEAFYQVFIKDRPVFVSTDAILQAWHRSYLDILQELEEVFLSSSMSQVLEGMNAQIPLLAQQSGETFLSESLLDADYFLAVARSLLAGEVRPSNLGQDSRVAAALQAIHDGMLIEFPLFGEKRGVDFSQFTVRGHYDQTETLKRYFRMMMWCGRIDLRLTPADPPWPPNSPSPEQSLRELGTAVVLHTLLSQAGQFGLWQQCDQVINTFVGWSDSMTFAQLSSLLTAGGIRSLADLPDRASIVRLQQALIDGDLGVQNILGDYYAFPLGPARARLPRSFAVLGQKFVLDSWALSRLVWPNVFAGEEGASDKVLRRIPSALDVAFSALGNSDCVSELARRLTDSNGRQFRDGLPYQRNLAAVHEVVNAQAVETWDSNLYFGWLAALRELSAPTTGEQYPDCMRTRAWAMKNLNTQLASWTHLRSATVLYAKQSYTGDVLCSYPFGFVEPRPEFFRRLKTLATRSAALFAALPMKGSYTYQRGWDPRPAVISLELLKAYEVDFMNRFASTMGLLEAITEKELAETPLSASESSFLRDLIEHQSDYAGYRTYSGWYPGLFYRNIMAPQYSSIPPGKQCDTWDALVTDVHTDVPAPVVGDPGCVLHEAVGNVWMLVVAVNNGPDNLIYAGPVFSHYEFEQPADKRLTETEWKTMILDNRMPPAPAWVDSYRVPGVYRVPSVIARE